MIAAGMGNHASFFFLRVKAAERVIGAPELKRTYSLKIFTLQKNLAATSLI
jgi:hypothetical protein